MLIYYYADLDEFFNEDEPKMEESNDEQQRLVREDLKSHTTIEFVPIDPDTIKNKGCEFVSCLQFWLKELMSIDWSV